MQQKVLEGLYQFITRRGKLLKVMGKTVARWGLVVLSRMKDFSVTSEISLANYYMLLGCYEQGTTALCKKILRPGMTVVDVGAHIGYYTRLFARLVGPHGKVYAFEPHPDNFAILQRNVRKFKNVVPVQAAVLDKEGEISLYESSIGTASHSLFRRTISLRPKDFRSGRFIR